MSENPPSQHGTGPGEPPGTPVDPSDPLDLFAVERLLAGPADPSGPADPAGSAQERALAELVGALRAPAGADELAVPDRVLAAFDAHAAGADAADGGFSGEALPSPRRKSMISTALAAKGMAAAAALALTTAGTAAAAFTGHLPGPLQAAAHKAVGAPDADHGKSAAHRPDGTPTGKPTPSVRPTGSAVGPDAEGSAAAGLCNAFAHGGLATTSTAYRNLVRAAGGPDAIPAFCATVQQHGDPSGSPTDKPGGKPTDKPGGRPTDKPGGRPTDKPTDRPTGSPTERPTDKQGAGKPSVKPTGKPTR